MPTERWEFNSEIYQPLLGCDDLSGWDMLQYRAFLTTEMSSQAPCARGTGTGGDLLTWQAVQPLYRLRHVVTRSTFHYTKKCFWSCPKMVELNIYCNTVALACNKISPAVNAVLCLNTSRIDLSKRRRPFFLARVSRLFTVPVLNIVWDVTVGRVATDVSKAS
jgi:hypothetical protein